jgi:tetratricopeptide (TPR) repeat protein
MMLPPSDSPGATGLPATWPPDAMDRPRTSGRTGLIDDYAIPVALAAIAFLVFSPSLRNEFVLWDDVSLFTNNQAYRGLGWTQIRWMFTTTLMGHWVPLTWLTHGLDYLIWGMNPIGYHLVNLLLHGANAALLYFIARRLLAKATRFSETALRLGAIAASLFFALHPLRVESVAWATERRDVLSGLFYLSTVLMYLKASETNGRARIELLISSVVLYVLAFASKSMVMTLPFVLILLDVYPLRRLSGDWRSWARPESRSLWREKVPYLTIALAGGTVAYFAQQQFFTSLNRLGWSARPWIALYGFWFYVAKTALPIHLSPLYELPLVVSPVDHKFLFPALGVVLVSAIALALRRRWPAGLAAWLYYGIVVAPVAGLTHAGFQLAHDRYSYLPCLGWALLIGAGVGAIVQTRAAGVLRPGFSAGIGGAAVLGLAGLGVLTWQQIEVWRTTENLWRYAIENEEACAICQNNLGALLYNEGHYAAARGYLERALQLRPDRDKVHKDLGLTLMYLGLNVDAIAHFRRAVELAPSDVEVRNDLGVALLRERRYQEALAHFRYALTIRPDDVMVLSNVGQVYVDIGTPERSLDYLKRSVALDPKAPRSHVALGLAYAGLGRLDAARDEYDIVWRLDRREASLVGPALLMEW